jgi:hypothetical protein
MVVGVGVSIVVVGVDADDVGPAPPWPAEAVVGVVWGLVVLERDAEAAAMEVPVALVRVALVPGEMPGRDRPAEVVAVLGAVGVRMIVDAGGFRTGMGLGA